MNNGDYLPKELADFELEQRALEACGYRVHIRRRNGTRWLMAVKGVINVQYAHWHPLTNIHQALQLLRDAPEPMVLKVDQYGAIIEGRNIGIVYGFPCTTKELVDAQCRAIVTACANPKPKL